MPSRVLVVEDDALVRRAYERVLSPDHAVVAVGSGHEALSALKQERFKAIVSDIDVPGLTGIDLLKAVRGGEIETPVVLVTGCPSLESAQDAVNYGAFSYLTKPVEPTALRDVVHRAIRVQHVLDLQRGVSAANGHASLTPTRVSDIHQIDSLSKRFDNALATLWMAYQPIVSWQERRVLGYEALVRNEEKSLVRPPDFLDAAERLGRLEELAHRVWKTIAEAIPTAPKGVRIFLNLLARDLEDDELLHGPLAPYADRIVLEITERASIEGIDDLPARVAALRRHGYWLAIDDLGAGYAGLTSVTQLEPEVVKLDMSLVRGVDEKRTQQQLIRSMVKVCTDLSMTVVTEGVETPAERDKLVELGCDVFQGYLFGRPGKGFGTPQF